MQKRTLQDLFMQSMQDEIPTSDQDFMGMVDKGNIGSQIGAYPMSLLENPMEDLKNSPKLKRLQELFAMLMNKEEQPQMPQEQMY